MSATPLVLPCPDQPPNRRLRRAVDEVLSAGGLASLPTETVYGLAARADLPAALEALRGFKGLDPQRALTWHVGSRGPLEHFRALPRLVARLAERYWPGPLTLVLQGVPPGLEGVARDGWTGVRLPAHRGTAGLLEALDYPVVMSSANRTGEPPLTDHEQVLARLGDGLALALDGGPARTGEASCVLAVGPGRFEVLRAGLLGIDDLRHTAGLRLAFVCTGNTCRSPMAAGLARHLLGQRLGLTPRESQGGGAAIERFGFEVASMGVAAGPGMPASTHAVRVLADQGIDISGHASRAALAEEMARFDHVYCLTHGHLESLRRALPPGRARNLELLSPEGVDVTDPIGGTLETYRRCAEQIRGMLEARLDSWV